MTCIVGLVFNKKVYMGGDSAGTDDRHDVRLHRDTKVFKNGPFLMGFTTSFRMGQLLHWMFVPPKHNSKLSDEKFMSTVFIDAVRKCLRDGGFAHVEDEVETGGTFLVGYRGQLYEVQDDFQVSNYLNDYTACGSGDRVAVGALFGTEGIINDPMKRVEIALRAAETFTASVKGPYTILHE